MGQRTTTVFPLGAVLHDMQPGRLCGSSPAMPPARRMRRTQDTAASSDDEDSDDSHQPAQAGRWVIYTDMALTSYTGQDSLDVVVRSLSSAQVMSGVRVTLVASNGEDLGRGPPPTAPAPPRGLFPTPSCRAEGRGASKMLMAYGAQSDLAVARSRPLAGRSCHGRASAVGPDPNASPLGGRSTATPIERLPLCRPRHLPAPVSGWRLVAHAARPRGPRADHRAGTARW